MTARPGTLRPGVVLVVVLWVLAILTVLSVALAGAVQSQRWHLGHLRADAWARESGRSALQIAQAVLLDDAPGADTLADAWAQPHEDLFVRPLNQGTLVMFAAKAGQPRLGLADESARVNANTATAEVLAGLPGLDDALAEAFIAARQRLAQTLLDAPDTLAGPAGGLTGPIRDEAQLAILLREAMAEIDALAPLGLAGGPGAPWANPRALPGGLAAALGHLTVHTRVRNLDALGQPRVNINTATEAQLLTAVGDVLGEELVRGIVRARDQQPYASVGELRTRGVLILGARDDLIPVPLPRQLTREVIDRMTVTDEPILAGLVNINTAPAEVLRCLPGLDDASAQAIVAARIESVDDPHTIGWLLDDRLAGTLSAEQFATVTGFITARSQHFRLHWTFLDPLDDSAAFGQAVLERDQGRCGVLVKESYRARRVDPRDWRQGQGPLSSAR